MSIANNFDACWYLDEVTGCHIWTAWKDKQGYGRFRVGSIKVRAHRFAYEKAKGPFSSVLQVLHRCDTPSCVNPDHLFLGTNSDNKQDCLRKKRQAFGEKQGLSKLTDAQVMELRERYKAKETQVSLAKRFGISQPTVSEILRGKTWRHLL